MLVILLLVFLLTEWLIPPFFTHRLEEGILASLQEVQGLKIHLKAVPSFFLLLGSVKDLHLLGEGVLIQDLRIHSFEGSYEQVRFPPIWRWGGEWQILGKNSFLEIKLKEEDLNQYLNVYFQDLLQLKISLLEGGVSMYTTIELYQMALNLEIIGKFQVTGPKRIDFVPEDLIVKNYTLPKVMVDYLLGELDFYFDLGEIPLPIYMTDVIMMEGEVLLIGGESS